MFVFSKLFDNKTLRKAVKVFGERNQEDVAIEEMSELIKALIKNRRYNTHKTREDVLEEMADVYIMLCQLYIIHGFDEQIVDEKIERLRQRIESAERINEDGKETEYIQKGVADTLKRMAVKSAETKAYKECIEKIKTRSSSCVASKDGIVIAGSRIYTISEVKLYEIEKEMVGDNNAT